MLNKIIFGVFLCCLQVSTAFADSHLLTVPGNVAGHSIAAEDETLSLLKTSSSSRLSTSFSYLPYSDGLSIENQPLVHIRLNDSIVATFLLDTGTNNSIISDEIVDQLKLPRQPILIQGKPSLFDGKPVNGAILNTMSLGGFKFQTCLLVVLSKKRLAFPNQPIDGILGVDLLQNFEIFFDFQQHRIRMLSRMRLPVASDGSQQKYVQDGLTPDEIAILGFTDAKTASLAKSEHDGKIYVHAQYSNAGKDASDNLMLDTGSVATNISPSTAKRLDLKPTSENIASTTFGGIKYISTAPLDRLQVGSLILDNQPIQYSSQRAYDKNVPLSLGMDILSKYQVLVDFTNQKVYFKPGVATVPLPTITIKPQ